MRRDRTAEEPEQEGGLPFEMSLYVTVFTTLAAMALPGGIGWLLTVPVVGLWAHRWPRLALWTPLLGWGLSAALYALARVFGAPHAPLLIVTLIYLVLAGAMLLALWPLRQAQRQQQELQARADHDRRVMEVLAGLAELGSHHELTPRQAAQEALRLTRELVPLDAALLFRSGLDGAGQLEPLLTSSGGPLVGEQTPTDPVLGRAHEAATPVFYNQNEGEGGGGARAVLPLRRSSEECLSLILLRREAGGRWDLHERQLLSAAARAVRLAAERQQVLQTLEAIANQDALTGCLNRHAFARTLRQLDASDRARSYAIVVMDLDGFKALNDHLGHAAGDELLCRFAQALGGRFFERDLLFRLGGDEFALILQDAARLELDSVRRRIASIPRQVQVGGLRWGVSLGVAQASEAPQADAVLRLADRRMYDMKRSVRARALSA